GSNFVDWAETYERGVDGFDISDCPNGVRGSHLAIFPDIGTHSSSRRRPAGTPILALKSTSLSHGRRIDGRTWSPRRSRAAERRRRAARCAVHLKAWNTLIARVGLLGLLAQDHGVVGAADRTRRSLEAERCALCEGDLRRSQQAGRNKGRGGETLWHCLTLPLVEESPPINERFC